MCGVHCLGASFRVFEYFDGLLVEPAFLVGFRCYDHAMRLGMVVFVEIREGGESVGGDFFRLAAAIHLGVNRQCGTSCSDDFALEGDDVAGKNRELEVNAMKHEKYRVFGVNILSHSKI